MNPKMIKYNPADFDVVKHIALTFPGTEESVSHEGTPSIKVRGKLMCRLHDNGEFIPIRLDFPVRDQDLESHPEIFHLPEHFKSYPYLCMWLHVQDVKLIQEVLEQSWRGLASKSQIKEYENSQT